MLSHQVDPAALARLLATRGMSKRELQRTTGLSWSFVKYVCRGERNLSATTAAIFATALRAPIGEFSEITAPTQDFDVAA